MSRLTRRTLLVGCAVLAAPQILPVFARSSVADDRDASTAAYDTLLARYVVPGKDGVTRVRYATWRANEADLQDLNAFIGAQSNLNPSTFDAATAFAYWANLYNALTLRVVLRAYPVSTIKSIKSTGTGFDLKALSGPWRTKLVEIEGVPMSLDDIEHGTMRPTFGDPRVHYAVNCASIGCPNLAGTAWRAATLDADLDAAARAYVNHPRGAAVSDGGSLEVSSLYKWYKEDFGSSDKGVIRHLQGFATEPLASALSGVSRIGGYDYDWSLNDA